MKKTVKNVVQTFDRVAFTLTRNLTKNPAYGRHQLSRPMRIVGQIQI